MFFRYEEHRDFNKQIIKDMMPTCFNVLVYQMDSTQKATAAAKTSFMDTFPSFFG